ncbi:MAG: hypothetical protein QXR05_07080 [Candidatus Methanomethylicia archaeon]
MNDRLKLVLGAILALILINLFVTDQLVGGGGTGGGSGNGSGGTGDGSGSGTENETQNNLQVNASVNMDNVSLDIIHYSCYEYNISYFVSANQGVPVSLLINDELIYNETIQYANRTHEYCLFDETIFSLTIHNQTYTSNVSVYVFPYESWNANLTNIELRNGRYYVNMTAYYYIDDGIKLRISFDADPKTLSKISNVKLEYQTSDGNYEEFNYQNESFRREDQRTDVDYVTFVITTIDGTIIAYSFMPRTGSLFDGYVYSEVINNDTLRINSVIFSGSEYITDVNLEYMVVGYDNSYRNYGSVPLSFDLPISVFSYVNQTGYFSIVLKLTYYNNDDILGIRYTSFNSIIISNNPQLSHNVNVQKVFEYKDESYCYANLVYYVNVSSSSQNIYAIDYYVNDVKLGTTYTETDQIREVIMEIFDENLYNGINNITLKIRHGSTVIYEYNDTLEIDCTGQYSLSSLGESQDPVMVCEDLTSSFLVSKWTQNGKNLRLEYKVYLNNIGTLIYNDSVNVNFSERGPRAELINFILPANLIEQGTLIHELSAFIVDTNQYVTSVNEFTSSLTDCNHQSYLYNASISTNAVQVEENVPYTIYIEAYTNKPNTYVNTIEVYFVEDTAQYTPGSPYYYFMDIFDYTGQNANSVSLSYESYLASYIMWTRSQGGFHKLEVRVTFSDGTIVTSQSNEFSNLPFNDFLLSIDNYDINPNNQQTFTLQSSSLLNNLINVTFFIDEDSENILPYSLKNFIQSFSFEPFQINSTSYTFPPITLWDNLTFTKISGIPVQHKIEANVTYQTINGVESKLLSLPPIPYSYTNENYSISVSVSPTYSWNGHYFGIDIATNENAYIDYFEVYHYIYYSPNPDKYLILNLSYYNQNIRSLIFNDLINSFGYPATNKLLVLVKFSNGVMGFNFSNPFYGDFVGGYGE